MEDGPSTMDAGVVWGWGNVKLVSQGQRMACPRANQSRLSKKIRKSKTQILHELIPFIHGFRSARSEPLHSPPTWTRDEDWGGGRFPVPYNSTAETT